MRIGNFLGANEPFRARMAAEVAIVGDFFIGWHFDYAFKLRKLETLWKMSLILYMSVVHSYDAKQDIIFIIVIIIIIIIIAITIITILVFIIVCWFCHSDRT